MARSTSNIALLATLLLVVIASAAAPEARALDDFGQFELRPCLFVGSNPDGYGSWSGPSGARGDWSLTARCPSDAEFEVGDTRWIDQRWTNWNFPNDADATNPIVSVSFDLKGGDGSDGGLEQAVAICNGEVCSDPIKTSGPATATPEHHELSAAGDDFPAGANQIRMAGRCTRPTTCSHANSLRLQNLDIVFADGVAPTIGASDFVLDRSIPALMPFAVGTPKQWNTGKRRFDVAATDGGSGVQSIVFQFRRPRGADFTYSTYWWEDRLKCGFVDQRQIGFMCPKLLQQEFVFEALATLHNFNLSEGPNQLTAHASDAAGNMSELIVVPFLLDSTRPAIADLQPSAGTEAGWQPGTTFSASWRNTGETAATGSASGLAGARWHVYPKSGSSVIAGFDGQVTGGVVSSLDAIQLPGQGEWRVEITTFDGAGNESLPQELRVGVDPTVLEAPAYETPTTLGALDLMAGASVRWQKPVNAGSAPSGLCGYALLINGEPVSDPGTEPGIDRDEISARLPGASYLPDGLSYAHLRAVSCAGVGGSIAHIPLTIDKSAPSIAVTEPGPGGWYSESHKLTASLVAASEPDVSMALALDGGALSYVPATTLDAPLVDGIHDLEVHAKDALGNESTLFAHGVKIDATPPAAKFAAQDQAQPTVVSALATDAGAGVSSAHLQFASAGSDDWQAFGSIAHPDGASAPSLQLSERFPDADLPAGRYRVRALIADAAGHRSASATADQQELLLPLRSSPSVTAGFATPPVARKNCKPRKCAHKIVGRRLGTRDFTTVARGEQATLTGSLHAAGGDPLSNSEIEVYESVVGRPKTLAAVVRTGPDGAYRFIAGAGPSRRITARFAGSDSQLPTEAVARFLVRPTVRFRVSPVRSGRQTKAWFSGRVIGPGATIPVSGLPITFEQRVKGEWVPFPAHAVADANGRFSAARVFPPLRRPLRFKLRAHVAHVDGWAYESGSSKAVEFEAR